jgi:hypothetical protein
MGTAKNLSIVINAIAKGRRFKSQRHVFVSADCTKAYDMVNRSTLFGVLEKRCESNADLHILQLLRCLYTGQKVMTDNVKSFTPERGVQQGSPLSPLLFAIYLEELLTNGPSDFLKKGTENGLLAYADDLVFMAKDKAEAKTFLEEL